MTDEPMRAAEIWIKKLAETFRETGADVHEFTDVNTVGIMIDDDDNRGHEGEECVISFQLQADGSVQANMLGGWTRWITKEPAVMMIDANEISTAPGVAHG